LFGILVNGRRDHLRARRPTEDIGAIAQRPVGQREALALVDLEGCTEADAAQIPAIPIGTVQGWTVRDRAAAPADVGLQLAERARRSPHRPAGSPACAPPARA
jgi:RNA polymerase sigma-70 factor, ECF subfamily